MEMKRIRVAVVGAGRMGQLRCQILYGMPEVELVAVVDVARVVGEKLAGMYHCAFHENLQELLGEVPVDGVVISTATFTHESLIKVCADSGVAVFCEKPIHGEPKVIRQLFAVCREKGVPLCCGFQRRFDASYRAAYDTVRNGDIGDVTMIRVMFADHPMPPEEFLRTGGDPFMDLAPHDVDFIRWVLHGEDPVEVHGMASGGPDLHSLVTIKFANNVLATLMMTRCSTYGYDQRIEIFGTKGKVGVGNEFENTSSLFTDVGAHRSKLIHSFPERFSQAFREELKTFADVIRGKREWPVTMEDCIETQRISQCASDSAKAGQVLRFPRQVTCRPIGHGRFGSYMINLAKNNSPQIRIMEPSFTRSSAEGRTLEDALGDCNSVYICTPDRTHLDFALSCLNANKHVLVEKPVYDFYKLKDHWEKLEKKSALMVGFHRRFATCFRQAKEFVKQCKHRITSITVISEDPVPADPDLVHVLYNSCSHDVDMICWLLDINDASDVKCTKLETDVTDSRLQIHGICNNGATNFVIQYRKNAPTYLQRVHLGDECIQRTFETPSATNLDQFWTVYEQAYEDQWNEFARLCYDPTNLVNAVNSFHCTFQVLDKIHDTFLQGPNTPKEL